MLKTYKAWLKNNQLEWLENPPSALSARNGLEVYVTVPEERPVAGEAKSGTKMVAAMEKLASIGGLADIIPDPVAWQQEIREDRELPGRD